MFCKAVVLNILVNHEKLFVVLAKCLKKFLNNFTFNTVTFQVIFQEFYLDFKLSLLLHFRLPRARSFQNSFFSHPFMVAGLCIT